MSAIDEVGEGGRKKKRENSLQRHFGDRDDCNENDNADGQSLWVLICQQYIACDFI